MNSFSRIVNHSKHVRLTREIGKRLMNNLDKQVTEMKKVAIAIWHKKALKVPATVGRLAFLESKFSMAGKSRK